MQSTRNTLLGSMASRLDYDEDRTWLSVWKLRSSYRVLVVLEVTFMGVYMVLGH